MDHCVPGNALGRLELKCAKCTPESVVARFGVCRSPSGRASFFLERSEGNQSPVRERRLPPLNVRRGSSNGDGVWGLGRDAVWGGKPGDHEGRRRLRMGKSIMRRAILATNRSHLPQLIAAAQAAIDQRSEELRSDGITATPEEYQAIADAQAGLRILMKELS